MLVLIILGMGVYGLKLRAFKAAVVAAFAALALFLGLFGGQVVMSFLKGGPGAVQPSARLVIYLVLMVLFFLVGLAAGAQYWFHRNIRLIPPLDQLFGVGFGLCAGVAAAAALSFLTFTVPGFEAAFFPPQEQLSNPINLGGPDPVLHLPYRTSQVAALVNGFGGGGAPPEGAGTWGAGLAAGTAGRDFYSAYATAETTKNNEPTAALEAWNSFLSHYTGTPFRSWTLRVERQKELLKPFLKKPGTFAEYVGEVIESGDLEALEVTVKDAERYFPDDPHTRQLKKAAGDVIPAIREIRKSAKENPSRAGRELRNLFRQYGSGPLRPLIVSEVRTITGTQPEGNRPRVPRKAPVKTPRPRVLPEDIAARAEQEAMDFAGKYKYAKALGVLRKARDRLSARTLQDRLSQTMQQLEVLESLHRRAVAAINEARGRKLPVPHGFGFSGHFEGATESYISFKKGRVPGIRSWSQFSPGKVLRLYVLFLGEGTDGLDSFRRFHHL